MYPSSNRIKSIPPYLFTELEKKIDELKAKSIDLISFGVGDPDLLPPQVYLTKLSEEVLNPHNHHYSFSKGEDDLRNAVAEWYKIRFGVELNPDSEVVILLGSKEGLANVARAFINDGDHVLVPDPAYPVYQNGATLLSDGIPILMPLVKDNEFLPDLNLITKHNAKMLYLNFPNNPTGAVADKQFLRELIEKAREKNIIICYDNAYSEIYFGDIKPPSILEVEGAREVAVEFHSCSKTLSITGDRIGFAVGNKDILNGLLKVKSQIDSGPPVFLQKAIAWALRNYEKPEISEPLKKNIQIYKTRRDRIVKGLNKIGLKAESPQATFYIWAECGCSSIEYAQKLLKIGVIATPGVGFGRYGEGFLRFSLTIPTKMIDEGLSRIQKMS